jgi:hypothetical protein
MSSGAHIILHTTPAAAPLTKLFNETYLLRTDSACDSDITHTKSSFYVVRYIVECVCLDKKLNVTTGMDDVQRHESQSQQQVDPPLLGSTTTIY